MPHFTLAHLTIYPTNRVGDKRSPAKALYCYVDHGGWEKEQRKTNKDMDEKRETRPCRKKHEPEKGPGYYQRQREVETSCKNLIVCESMIKERKGKRQETSSYITTPYASYYTLLNLLTKPHLILFILTFST